MKALMTVALALTVLTVGHLHWRSGSETSLAPLVAVGSPADGIRIADQPGASGMDLSTWLDGRCGLVVLAPAWCSASAAHAERWVKRSQEHSGAPGEGWSVLWLLLDHEVDTEFPDWIVPFPFTVRMPHSPFDRARAFGLSAFPGHMIIDREGIVQRIGQGTEPTPRQLSAIEGCPGFPPNVSWTATSESLTDLEGDE